MQALTSRVAENSGIATTGWRAGSWGGTATRDRALDVWKRGTGRQHRGPQWLRRCRTCWQPQTPILSR